MEKNATKKLRILIGGKNKGNNTVFCLPLEISQLFPYADHVDVTHAYGLSWRLFLERL